MVLCSSCVFIIVTVGDQANETQKDWDHVAGNVDSLFTKPKLSNVIQNKKLTTSTQHVMFTVHMQCTHTHTYIYIQTDRQIKQTETILLDVSLEERGGIVPTLVPQGLGLWLLPSFPFLLNVTISETSLNISDYCLWSVNGCWIICRWGLFNTWTMLLYVLLHLVTRMSEQWSHNMNYNHKKWTMITSCHE